MKRNSHPVKVVEVKDYEGLYANSHPYKVEIEGGGGGEYSDFTGATEIMAGEHGLVPAPQAGEQDKYLKGDGTWETVSGGIPTNATFWGASYDSVNNAVSEDITLDQSKSQKIKSRINSSGYFYLDGVGNPWLHGAGVNGKIVGINQNGKLYLNTGIQFGNSTSKIESLADPTAAQDAATKNYTDNLVISYASLNGAGAPTTATEAKYVGQLYYDTTNGNMYYCSAITAQGTTPETYTYTWNTIGGSSVNVVQTTGTSQTDVMSQKATSQMIYPSGSETNKKKIAIGAFASASDGSLCISANASSTNNASMASGVESVAIGNRALATGTHSIAIGTNNGNGVTASGEESIAIGTRNATASHPGSIAIGAYSTTSRSYEVSIGTGTAGSEASYGIRYIAHVHDPQYATDAANKNYVDNMLYSPSEFNTLWEDA